MVQFLYLCHLELLLLLVFKCIYQLFVQFSQNVGGQLWNSLNLSAVHTLWAFERNF